LSFWWVEALAMMGEVDEAVALFRRLEKYANPLGLFSEDIDPSTGELLGNFPQAYTHVGLIHAAINGDPTPGSGLFRLDPSGADGDRFLFRVTPRSCPAPPAQSRVSKTVSSGGM
jgi:hypothetical protein